MRIAVDARVLSLPELRGIGSYLCELLAAWPDPDDSFVLFAPETIPAERLRAAATIEVVRVPEPRGSRFRVWDWWSLPRAARRTSPDLLWSPANQAMPLAGIPQVVTIHDTLQQEYVRHGSLLERAFHLKVAPRWVRRHATRIVTVSTFAAQRIQAVFACEASRLRVISNGTTVAARPFENKEQARSFLRDSGLADRPFVLALGAQSPWKNTCGAMRAFALAALAAPGVDFVLAGVQERARQGFETLRSQLGLGDRLRILGFVNPLARDALYQGAEVFVYPSLFEGFGLPPLEAMALGTPVVASWEASIPEVTGKAAMLVDATDPEALASSLLKVLRSPELAKELAAAGLNNILRFKWDVAAKAHHDVFKECLAA